MQLDVWPTRQKVRDIALEDLLPRKGAIVDWQNSLGYLSGKRVLITGAGGSIGSELVRQTLVGNPAEIILLGHGENSIFEIEQELRRDHNRVPICVIADIRDYDRLLSLFEKHRPHVVFHAAAHKHVGLMESNPEEAVTNNVLGTRNLIRIASQTGVMRFAMISSDKAVNPISIMGATKRIAEMIVEIESRKTRMDLVTVRFGNVLGSRGSVVPLMQKQILKGGPVTVTHEEATRYFMTIPEAAQLVIQAGALGGHGAIYMLDMGEPVRIMDLALNLIRLSGYTPYRDIPIEVIGLKPGEKIFEELFSAEEYASKTSHERIYIAKPIPLDADELDEKVDALIRAAQIGHITNVLHSIHRLIPDFADHRPKAALTLRPRLSSSEALLLACTDLRSDGAADARIDATLSGSSLDWAEVIRLAIRHGVAANLTWHLRRFPDDSRVPPQIRAILERIYSAQARRNEAMFQAAGELVTALQASGIPGLILKGVGLAQTVYPDHALRIFADIDLLVPSGCWEGAGTIAEREDFPLERKTTAPLDYHLPYVRVVAEDILSDCLAPEFDETHTLEALGAAVNRIVVEIHRSAFTLPGGFSRAADNGPLWKNSRIVTLPGGNNIRIPGPEAMIVHLATHAARHRYNRLMFMGDMVQTLRTWQAEIDWVCLVDLVSSYGAQNPVWRMLDLAQREFGVVIPADVLLTLKPGPNAGPDGLPLDAPTIFLGMELMMKAPSAITWKQLLSERSARQVVISVANILFPAPSIIGRYYRVRSPVLIAGCYVIRPFQLLGRFLGVMVRTSFVERSRRRLVGDGFDTGRR